LNIPFQFLIEHACFLILTNVGRTFDGIDEYPRQGWRIGGAILADLTKVHCNNMPQIIRRASLEKLKLNLQDVRRAASSWQRKTVS